MQCDEWVGRAIKRYKIITIQESIESDSRGLPNLTIPR